MMDHRRTRQGYALCLLLALAAERTAFADWAGFAQYGAVAEISIEPGAVDMDIRIKESVFTNPAETGGGSLVPGLLRLKDENGHIVEGRMESFNGAGAVQGKADAPYFEARVHFDVGGKPDTLTLVPAPQPGQKLGVVVSHRGVPLADLGALEAPARLTLDWNDPWRSRFDAPGRIRRHSAPRSFLYVEPYEVRHEVLLRLDDLAPYLRFKPKDPQNLSASEREFLKQGAGDFLRTRNPVRINGAAVEPQIDRVEFLCFGRQGMRKAGDSEPLYPASALVGAILVYLTEAPAETVDLQWELFDPGLERRPVTLFFGKESFEFEATPRDPLFRWSSEEALGLTPEVEQPATALAADDERSLPAIPLQAAAVAFLAAAWLARRKHPVLAGTGLAAAAAMLFPQTLGLIGQPAARTEAFPRPQVQTRLEALLHNVYRAYALRSEEASYDRLAMSLDGPLLEDVYLRQRRAVLARNQGLGGEGRVSRIEVLGDGLATRKLGPSRFEVTGRWIAHGTVSHWGHSHDRHTLYAARMVLNIAEDGTWKITAMDLLEGRPSAPSARS
ncbi:hypothetical protein ABZN20_05035 [Methylococcus sp. ANG]|uniref:hypothetical protein n=1 Tax=Methylococcus sp. ANG TaxID=3231903 RepID=UPI00345AF031